MSSSTTRSRRGRERAPLPAGFGTIWTSVALDLVGFGIVLPILPLYARRFGASAVTASGLIAAFSGAQLIFSPIWGRLSDRVGRKPILVLSLAGTAVASLVTGLAPAVWVLFLGRVLDGISGASVSVAQAAVTDLAPPEERARLLGLIGAAFGLGFVMGPAIGGLAALGGPHVPFFVAAAIAGVNAVVASRRLPETHPGRTGSSPGLGPPERNEDASSVAEPTGVVVAEAAAFKIPGVAALLAVAFMALSAFSAFEATFALFGDRRLDLHLASTGGVFAAVGIVIVLVQGGLVRPAVRAAGERQVLLGGLLLNAAGLAALAGVHSFITLAPALLLLTVGQGLASPTLASALAGRVGAHRRGGLLGLQQAAGGLARVVGPLAGGFAFGHIGVPAPYLAGAALTVLAAAVVVGAVPNPPASATDVPPVHAAPI